MDLYNQLAQKIINKQLSIIGPVAFEQAKKVNGLIVDSNTNKIVMQGNELKIIDQLIEQYRLLFGNTSVEACKDAVRDIIKNLPSDQIPPLLK